MEFTHFNEQGRAKMVDVSNKPVTLRCAQAQGEIHINDNALRAITEQRVAKGDVLAVAQVAAVMAAKKTADVIPMCHNIPITGVDVSFEIKKTSIAVFATVKCTGNTGVEMEALHAVSVACLTIYDMVKALDKGMTIGNIQLLAKSGGTSGEFVK